jgi:hypothetical protein
MDATALPPPDTEDAHYSNGPGARLSEMVGMACAHLTTVCASPARKIAPQVALCGLTGPEPPPSTTDTPASAIEIESTSEMIDVGASILLREDSLCLGSTHAEILAERILQAALADASYRN